MSIESFDFEVFCQDILSSSILNSYDISPYSMHHISKFLQAPAKLKYL